MFAVGDVVMYGTQGVCKIHEVCTKKFGKTESEYFLLRPYFDPKSVIYVPTDQDNLLSQMREVLTRNEVNDLIAEISSGKIEWIDNDNERQDVCNEIIRSGDRVALMRLIQMLYDRNEELKGQKKHFHIADERNLKRAEKLLHEEFAYVLGLQPADIPAYISERL